MIANCLENVQANNPLIHCITNYVTVNDCANILLAVGASPIMADDLAEVEEITSICSALVINIGTLNQRTIQSMLIAGKKANECGIPVILDPVGAGASKLRNETTLKLLDTIKFSVIRGNASEIKFIHNGYGKTKGVDVSAEDAIFGDELEQTAKNLSRKTNAVVIVTGVVDLITDGLSVIRCSNGHAMMSKITGSGCMLSALIGAFSAANRKNLLEACAAGVALMGLSGEIAFQRCAAEQSGTSSFRTFLIDQISIIDTQELEKRAKLETIG